MALVPGVNIPIALIAAVAAVPIVQESKAQGDTRYDIPGAVLCDRSAWCRWSTASPRRRGCKNPARAPRSRLDVTFDARFPGRGRRAAGRVRRLGDCAPRTRCCPLRVVLDRNRGGSYLVVPARRRRAVRHVPVPDLLLPAHPGLQPAEGRLRVPAVQRRHHRRRRVRRAAAAASRAAGRYGRRPGRWRCRHAAADPDQRGPSLRRARPAAAHRR